MRILFLFFWGGWTYRNNFHNNTSICALKIQNTISECFLLNFRSGLKRGVFVHFNCLDSTCDHFEFELTTSCGGGGSAELPWVIECLSKSDPNFEICSLLHHDHSKRIDQMSLNLQFTSHPQLDLFIGTKKIEVDQSTMAGNSLDIKVNAILLYYILHTYGVS